jgi:hypothetical protein
MTSELRGWGGAGDGRPIFVSNWRFLDRPYERRAEAKAGIKMESYVYLSAEIDPDDGSVRLILSFVAERYAGEGVAWLDRSQLDDFAGALLNFPIDRPVSIEGGYFATGETRFKQVHLGVQVRPADRGLLWFDVQVAQPWDDTSREEPRSFARHSFLIDYETLATFQRRFRSICSGEKSDMRLDFPLNL